MIVFKIAFVLALMVPVALLLYFLFSKMTEELSEVKSNHENQFAESNLEKRRKTKSSTIKKKPIAKSSDRRVRKERREGRKEVREGKPDKTRRKKRKKRISRSERAGRNERAQVQTRTASSYPKDPYADFKRPDFDAFISDANKRDRQR